MNTARLKLLIRTPDLWVLTFVTLFGAFSVADVIQDLRDGQGKFHLIPETAILVFCLVAVVFAGQRLLLLLKENHELKANLSATRADLAHWRSQNAELLRGLSGAIDSQLEKWHLSGAEKDIAFLLLKGLSIKEIANLRGTSERTVRQQSLGIYNKSGLAGRAELSAFFLEDLLSPLVSQ